MQLKHLWEQADVSRVKQFFLIGLVLWTALIGIFAVAVYYHQQDTAQEFARLEAVASFEKDLDYRHWAAGHGGVYVPSTEKTPPNPYLAHVAERDIATKSGRALTLLNPAYMTRQVHELGKERRGIQGRITSLNPLRPENAPDAWEAEALKALERGKPELSAVVTIGGKPHMRVMRPLPVEESCLKCHAHPGVQGWRCRRGNKHISSHGDLSGVAQKRDLALSIGACHPVVFWSSRSDRKFPKPVHAYPGAQEGGRRASGA